MKALWFMSAAMLIAAPGLAEEDKKPLKSGLQPGENAGAYNVLDLTGPNKGKKLCYR